ncbi:MAG: ABC transporter ATP-binding protein [Pedobacter sp.]|jgi:ATP-binding cassette subfamily B protein|uniref:ABC transporter ATP-binding protein n=1 Tax=Pedobacter sp. TaxID=1411316 RepID=UPI00356176FC
MIGLLRPYWGKIVLLLLLALLGNALSLLLPKLIGKVIDGYSHQSFDMDRAMWQFAGITFLVFSFGYLQGLLQIYTSEKVSLDLRTKLAVKISKQGVGFIAEHTAAKLLTNLTSDVEAVKAFVSQAIVSIISSVVIIFGSAILLFGIDWQLGLIVICITSTIGVTFYLVLKKVKAKYKVSREVIDRLNKIISESILGAFLVRVVNSQHLEYDKFLVASVKGRDLGLSILRLFAWLIPIITFTASMAALVILVYGGHLVIIGRMSIGELAAFNSYLAMLIFPIIIIGFMSNVIVQATVSYERVQKALNWPDELHSGTLDVALTGKLSVTHINLAYGDKKVLKNISFDVSLGSKVAIVGPTVAGKTTLLSLLAGMVNANSGDISYDGHPLAELSQDSFYRQLAFVFQDSVMFNMSLRENIAFSKEVTDAALVKAIESSELSDFVDSLPNGLETDVSERGLNLSGGQKQRIMLARALAIGPKILLLDDFTARVDQQTEQRILANINANYPGITLISVAQKIAAVADYDQIILMMEGELLDKGTHLELMEKSPEYVQLFNSQRSTNSDEL